MDPITNFKRRLGPLAVTGALVVGVSLGGAPGTALAGDVHRYTDRAEWPDWAVQRYMDIKGAEDGGEMWEAIAFELVQGYAVEAKDPWKYEDRAFRFFNPVSRAEFATMLSRSLGLATDAETGLWYTPHVDALKKAGVIPADASDAWNAPISRREAGQWMGRAADAFQADADRDTRDFADVDDPLITRAIRAGIVQGAGDGRFEPDRTLIRGEAAVMLLRLAKAINAQVRGREDAVFAELTGIIKQLDNIAARESWNRVVTGKTGLLSEFDPAAADLATPDMLRYGLQQTLNTSGRASQDHQNEWTWAEQVEDAYQFETVEIHDTIAVVRVANAAVNLYRGVQKEFLRRGDYSGYQYFVKRDGKWLLCAAK